MSGFSRRTLEATIKLSLTKMKLASITVGFCSAVFVVAFPEPTDLPQNQAGCDAPVSLNASTNIFKEYKLHPQIIYRRRAEVAAEVIADAELKSRALKVAYAGQFVWMQVSSLPSRKS